MTPAMAYRYVQMAIDYVAASSLSLFIEVDGIPRDPGTGTCIRIGDHFLVATAAHNILDEQLSTVGLAVFDEPDARTPVLVGCGLRGGGVDDPVDVAWIEISPGAARQIPKRFLTIDCLRTGVAHAPAELAFVHGFPRARMETVFEEGKLAAVITEAVGFGTDTIGPERLGERFKPKTDAYIDWPKGEVSPGAPSRGYLKELPNAPGMSGCGMWLLMHREPIWAPQRMRMFAIQQSWHEEERWLRGTQVQHWLRMVVEDLPDARDEVLGAFPDLLD